MTRLYLGQLNAIQSVVCTMEESLAIQNTHDCLDGSLQVTDQVSTVPQVMQLLSQMLERMFPRGKDATFSGSTFLDSLENEVLVIVEVLGHMFPHADEFLNGKQ